MNSLKSKNLNFKELEISDVNESYVKWLKDKVINKFIIQKNIEHTFDSLKEYVKKHRDSKNDFLFGIFENKKNTHIGNIKLTISHPKEKIANIGLLIGEKNFQGKGYGIESIDTITKFGMNELNLIRIEAGFLDINQKSLHCFLKCGYTQDGHLRSYWVVDNKRVGRILVSIIKNG
jgi:RimJ/RimL family protein N-acetyltransferase